MPAPRTASTPPCPPNPKRPPRPALAQPSNYLSLLDLEVCALSSHPREEATKSTAARTSVPQVSPPLTMQPCATCPCSRPLPHQWPNHPFPLALPEPWTVAF
jgi:hypothetical protein